MAPAVNVNPYPVEDEYELSPMQQGMLYHTIASSQRGMYCIVVSYRLEGHLDPETLFAAWQAVVERHPVLRTSFHWKNRTEPVQAVHRRVVLPVVEHDWRGIAPSEQQHRLRRLIEAENRRGFDVMKPPLMRLSLVRLADAVHELVLTHHHLLLDGSCKPLLLGDVFAVYDALARGTPLDLAPPEPYRTFIEWLREQDLGAAERFWREELSGFRQPTPLWPAPRTAAPTQEYAEHQLLLDEQTSDQLRQFGRSNRLTLNTIVSGAWALLLGQAHKRNDVVFGATVNARPATLDRVEAMLGLFINTLPVRMTIAPHAPLVDWLRSVQLRQIDARGYDFAPLSLIQRWSDVPRRLPLFESIVVFENNPGYGSGRERHGSVEITNVRALIRNSLPLTLRCVPGRSLSMQLLHDAGRFSSDVVAAIGDQLVTLLTELPHSGDVRLMRLMDRLERHRTALEAHAYQSVRDKLWQRTRDKRHAQTSES